MDDFVSVKGHGGEKLWIRVASIDGVSQYPEGELDTVFMCDGSNHIITRDSCNHLLSVLELSRD